MRRLLAVVLVAMLVAACSGEPTVTAEERERVMAALATDVYLAGYETFAEAATVLRTAIDSGCSNQNLDAAFDAWEAASDAWLATSAYRFGPTSTRLVNAVAYPIDADKIDAAAGEVADPAEVAELGSDARGLDAIGYSLRVHGSDACPYLAGAALRVDETAQAILEGWRGDEGYAAELSTDMGSQDGVEMAINELIMAIDDLVFFRLQGGLDAERGEANASAVLRSIASAYRGVDGAGLSSLVAVASEDADQRVTELLDRLETTPPAEAGETATELRTLISTEVASLLSATLLLGDGDGDA